MIITYTDGGARGNPGPAAYGVYIAKNGEKIAAFGKTIGIATNNVAEYQGVIAALAWLLKNKEHLVHEKTIHFFADSQLIISQITGVYRVKSPVLALLLIKVKTLEKNLGMPISYQHIRREFNKEADKQVNIALDNKA